MRYDSPVSKKAICYSKTGVEEKSFQNSAQVTLNKNGHELISVTIHFWWKYINYSLDGAN